jgi:membrane-bound ClpP family serine protease
MLTKIMKWVCIGVLLLAMVRIPTTSYQVLLEILICVGALLVVAQAFREGKYFWVAGFTTIAVIFNPIIPVTLSRKTFLWLDAACLMAFLVSFAAFKRRPLLSIPSITNRTPGSESL